MNQNFEITHARSKNNGIIFFSTIQPEFGFETFLDETGEIHNQITCTTIEEYKLYQESVCSRKKTFVKKWMAIAFLLFLVSFATLVSIFFKTPSPVISALYFSAFASDEIFQMINFSHTLKIKDKNNYSVAKFHSAEHMAVHAYNKLNRIPTLEEIKKFSRFSKNCGSMRILNKISFFVLFSVILLAWDTAIFFVLVICFLVFMLVAMKTGAIRFLQIFVTSKPTDKELLVAIEGLKFYESMEKNLGILSEGNLERIPNMFENEARKLFDNNLQL